MLRSCMRTVYKKDGCVLLTAAKGRRNSSSLVPHQDAAGPARPSVGPCRVPLQTRRRVPRLAGLALAATLLGAVPALAALKTPEQAFGFRPGADQKLASWEQVLAYLTELAAGSNELRVIDLGQTTMG